MASIKPGSRRRKKPSNKGTVKGAVEFALNPKRVALRELRKAFYTGGVMRKAKPN